MAKVGKPRICIVPRMSGVGGMVSFQKKLAAGLIARGVEICFDLADRPYSAVLVIGGTRHLPGLWQTRRKGVPIIQRLDGINWLHRRLRTGVRHYLRAEYGNLVLRVIRRQLADHLVYQSLFVRSWWEQASGRLPKPASVIYNGVDLSEYTPGGASTRPPDRHRLLLVEGSLMGGYELGIEHAVRLGEEVNKIGLRPVELMIAGRVSPTVRARWETKTGLSIRWAGLVPNEQIPELDRSAHLLFSADLNAACPNAVIEAFACGLPVVAFKTGALPELVSGEAGRLAPYGGDPWHLERPDFPALSGAAAEILQNQETFRAGARRHANSHFSLEKMVDEYLNVFDQV